MLGNGIFHGMYNPAVVWLDDEGAYLDGNNDYLELLTTQSVATQKLFLAEGSVVMRIRCFDAANDFYIWEMQCSDGGELSPKMRLWYDNSEGKLKFQREVNDEGFRYPTSGAGHCEVTISAANMAANY